VQTLQAEKFIEENAAKPFAHFLSWHPPHNWDGEYGYNGPADLLKFCDPAKPTLRPNVEDTPQIRPMYQGYMANTSGQGRLKGRPEDFLAGKIK